MSIEIGYKSRFRITSTENNLNSPGDNIEDEGDGNSLKHDSKRVDKGRYVRCKGLVIVGSKSHE